MKVPNISDSRLRELVDELCSTIRARYPEAVFRVYPPNGDPKSVTIDAYTPEEVNGFRVLDLVAERAVDILVSEDYEISIIPMPLSALRDSSELQ